MLKALKAAFPKTIPIMTGFIFLGTAYGIYARSEGLAAAEPPDDVDSGKFYFWVTLLNQAYWVTGAAIGSLAGSFIGFEIKGLDFVMTALLVVIFLDNWLKEKNHASSLIGIGAAAVCLLIFGSSSFIIPSMAVIVLLLTVFRKKLEKAVDGK